MELPVYKIKEEKGKWSVVKLNGSKVNGVEHATRKEAERQLSILVAYKICSQENSNAIDTELQKH